MIHSAKYKTHATLPILVRTERTTSSISLYGFLETKFGGCANNARASRDARIAIRHKTSPLLMPCQYMTQALLLLYSIVERQRVYSRNAKDRINIVGA